MATLGFSFYPDSINVARREMREINRGIKHVKDPKTVQALLSERVYLSAKITVMNRLNRDIEALRSLEAKHQEE